MSFLELNEFFLMSFLELLSIYIEFKKPSKVSSNELS